MGIGNESRDKWIRNEYPLSLPLMGIGNLALVVALGHRQKDLITPHGDRKLLLCRTSAASTSRLITPHGDRKLHLMV